MRVEGEERKEQEEEGEGEDDNEGGEDEEEGEEEDDLDLSFKIPALLEQHQHKQRSGYLGWTSSRTCVKVNLTRGGRAMRIIKRDEAKALVLVWVLIFRYI